MALNVYLTPCKRIWQGYKLYAALAFVARKGFELTCLADDTEMPVDVPARFWTRGESDLEH